MQLFNADRKPNQIKLKQRRIGKGERERGRREGKEAEGQPK